MDNSLQHFANDGQKCDRAVVTGVGHAAFLVNWNYKGFFPSLWELW